jgi:hypothetical protein
MRIDDLAADLVEVVPEEARLDLNENEQLVAVVRVEREVREGALLPLVSRQVCRPEAPGLQLGRGHRPCDRRGQPWLKAELGRGVTQVAKDERRVCVLVVKRLPVRKEAHGLSRSTRAASRRPARTVR